MKKRPSSRRGISRIDQPSTRTHGWFVRTAFYRRSDGHYAPRYSRFFGDVSNGGKRAALRAAKDYLEKLASKGRKRRTRTSLAA